MDHCQSYDVERPMYHTAERSSWCHEAGKPCAHLLLVCRSEPGLGRRRTRALGGLQCSCCSAMRLLPGSEMHDHAEFIVHLPCLPQRGALPGNTSSSWL